MSASGQSCVIGGFDNGGGSDGDGNELLQNSRVARCGTGIVTERVLESPLASDPADSRKQEFHNDPL